MIELTLKFEEASEEMIRDWRWSDADIQIIGTSRHPVTFEPVALISYFHQVNDEDLLTVDDIALEAGKAKYYYAKMEMNK
jgi:hypothetical protein